MSYKLLAADMDGTLLNEKSQLSQRTIETIRAAVDAGMLFVPSTGRPYYGLDPILEAFEGDFPVIIYNGAAAMTLRSKQVFFTCPLPFAHAQAIYAEAVARGIPATAWADERLYANCDREDIQAYRNITQAELHVITDLAPLREAGVMKVLWITENAMQFQPEMQARFQGEVNCFGSRSSYLEFVNTKASKGLALCEIGKRYGIAPSEMIAVGDGYNDVPMLEVAGLSVAMANAPEDIRNLCDAVTLSNEEDGVAALIEKYILGGTNQ